jgi:hypothetical protein
MSVVSELNVIARPEVAVALAVVVPPTLKLAGVRVMAPMVWSALFTLPLTVSEVEPAKFPSPL